MRFREEENTAFLQRRLPFAALTVLAFVAAIASRLFYLQILNGEQYNRLATEILVREEEIVARRGDILDRNNAKLADTRPYFEITVTPQHMERPARTLEVLTRLLPVPREEIQKRLDEAKFVPGFFPVVVAGDVSYDLAAKLREHLAPEYAEDSPDFLNGVSLRVTPLRRYLYPELLGHALGYLREVSPDELEEFEKSGHSGTYSPGDLVGAAGLEKSYDAELKGSDGQLARVVDARGREIAGIPEMEILREQATVAPVAGYHLRTTLDLAAQKAAAEGMAGRKGAVVALDPQNGEILVMYSSPGFDANRIMKKIDKAYWRKINLDEDKYLFNRAIQAMYPPASTYKPIGVVAGVASGKIDPLKTRFSCGGGLSFGNRFFKCWNRGGHGSMDVLHGLAQSCDVFFYQVGRKVGVDGLAEYARLLGYGAPTGVDIPFEKAGLVPTSEWKKKRYNQDWIESETLSVAIGQSYNLVTPLQNAKMAAMIANGGYSITPHLAKDVLNPDGSVFRSVSYPKMETPLVGSEAVAWARKGMIEVVHGAGTATRLRASPYRIAGKTGTAQVIGHDSRARRGVDTRNHGLFISFAPYDDPRIAVSVIVEHGLSGSGSAAPVAMKVIDAYLGRIMPVPPEPRE